MSDNPGPGLTDEIVEEAHDLIQEVEEEAHMDENMQVSDQPLSHRTRDACEYFHIDVLKPHPELASQSKPGMASKAKSSMLGTSVGSEGSEEGESMMDKVKDTLHMQK